jgi:hypothetical protein
MLGGICGDLYVCSISAVVALLISSPTDIGAGLSLSVNLLKSGVVIGIDRIFSNETENGIACTTPLVSAVAGLMAGSCLCGNILNLSVVCGNNGSCADNNAATIALDSFGITVGGASCCLAGNYNLVVSEGSRAVNIESYLVTASCNLTLVGFLCRKQTSSIGRTDKYVIMCAGSGKNLGIGVAASALPNDVTVSIANSILLINVLVVVTECRNVVINVGMGRIILTCICSITLILASGRSYNCIIVVAEFGNNSLSNENLAANRTVATLGKTLVLAISTYCGINYGSMAERRDLHISGIGALVTVKLSCAVLICMPTDVGTCRSLSRNLNDLLGVVSGSINATGNHSVLLHAQIARIYIVRNGYASSSNTLFVRACADCFGAGTLIGQCNTIRQNYCGQSRENHHASKKNS